MDNVQLLNLERKDLDIKCPRKIRVRIADEIIDEWYLVGRELDVSDKKLMSIRSDNSLTLEEKAVAVLDAWAEEHGSRATCLRLAEALHRRIKTGVIEILCGEVTQIKRDATTLGAGAATAPQPSDNQQQKQGHHILEHDDEVVTRINELDSQFRLLHEKMESELELKKVTVRKLIRSLSLLPYDIEQEYKQTITEKLPDLHKEEEVSDIFCLYINPLVSFMDYGLTKHIIDQYGSNTLKKEMNDYSKDVIQFMKKTTVKEMMDHWPGPQKIPPNYSVLMVTINENPKTYTLYDVDKLRKLYCSELKMSTLTFKTIRLKMSNSFIVEWLVPSALVPHLVESAKQVNFGFYFHKRILKVVVGEKQIFPFLPDSKPKVPALQTTAAMDTIDTMAEQEVSTSVQMKGTPGESAALYVGPPKRSRSYTGEIVPSYPTARSGYEASDESEELLPLTPQKRQSERLIQEGIDSRLHRRRKQGIRGTLETYELYTVADNINPKDEPQPVKDEHPSEKDIKFMKEAYKVSKRSKDDSTKVGAIIVNPATGDTLGEGWDRMPAGCEETFGWSKGDDILKTKYPYVLHAVRAAILDALKKKADLKGTTVYATLIPDHIDSQMIREVGIKRVVFVEDKYSEFAFTIASKRILDGLEWRQITMPKENKSKPEDSENSD